MLPPYSKLQAQVAEVARRAGDVVMQHYQQESYTVRDKSDNSPVTDADIAVSDFLTSALSALQPSLPVLSEEAIVPWHERRGWQRYWLIDPIDGTSEFINRSGDFAVSIALIDQYQPVLGTIYWPVQDILYQAMQGHGATRLRSSVSEAIQVRQLANPVQDELIIATSRRQSLDKIFTRMNPQRPLKTLATGSCSLKSCLVAEGSADCFLRVGPTGEWDTGAAQVIIEEAGGSLVSEHFEPVTYNRTASLDNPNFLVLGDPRVDWKSVFPGKVRKK